MARDGAALCAPAIPRRRSTSRAFGRAQILGRELAEIMNEDGTMARLDDLVTFASAGTICKIGTNPRSHRLTGIAHDHLASAFFPNRSFESRLMAASWRRSAIVNGWRARSLCPAKKGPRYPRRTSPSPGGHTDFGIRIEAGRTGPRKRDAGSARCRLYRGTWRGRGIVDPDRARWAPAKCALTKENWRNIGIGSADPRECWASSDMCCCRTAGPIWSRSRAIGP